jgi:Outer membrane protein beta-barrel domain
MSNSDKSLHFLKNSFQMIYTIKKLLIVLVNLCFFLVYAQGQEEETVPNETSTEITRRFNGGFTAGFNASQIDGDGLIGFNKLGAYAGIEANVILTEKVYLGFDITYSERGSSTALTGKAKKINFNMLEVPIMVHLCDWKSEEGFYYVHAGAGLCYSRLINAAANNTIYQDYTSSFKTDNMSWVLETMFYTNKHFGFGARFNKSFNEIYKQPNSAAPNSTFVERWLTFRAVYLF